MLGHVFVNRHGWHGHALIFQVLPVTMRQARSFPSYTATGIGEQDGSASGSARHGVIEYSEAVLSRRGLRRGLLDTFGQLGHGFNAMDFDRVFGQGGSRGGPGGSFIIVVVGALQAIVPMVNIQGFGPFFLAKYFRMM